jgi:hypothetical protein
VRQAVAVADDLVQDVRLGRVERQRVVPDVLRRVEDPVAERAVELAQRDEAGGRHVAEAGERRQELVDLVELGDPVLGQLQACLAGQVLGAGQVLVQGVQLAADHAPDVVLGLGVVDLGQRLAVLPRHRERRDAVAAPAVDRVGRPRMIVTEVDDGVTLRVRRHRRVELGFLEHRIPPGVSASGRAGRARRAVVGRAGGVPCTRFSGGTG